MSVSFTRKGVNLLRALIAESRYVNLRSSFTFGMSERHLVKGHYFLMDHRTAEVSGR